MGEMLSMGKLLNIGKLLVAILSLSSCLLAIHLQPDTVDAVVAT